MHAIGAAQLLTHYAAMIEPRNRRGEAETCRWYTTGRASDGAPHHTHAPPHSSHPAPSSQVALRLE